MVLYQWRSDILKERGLRLLRMKSATPNGPLRGITYETLTQRKSIVVWLIGRLQYAIASGL